MHADYFGLFGLPEHPRLDRDALDAARDRLRRVVHPDRFASASARERRVAAERAGLINEAYLTLSDPVRRAEHLLRRRGVEPPETGGEPEFLERLMSAREKLADLRAAGDAEGLAAMAEETDAELAEVERAFAEAYEIDDWTAAVRVHARMRFIAKLGAEIAESN